MEELQCQIRNVHPATLRLQKRVQPSSAAPRAVIRLTGATGAGNRAFPTSARNVDLGDREVWEVLL